ncbi:MAG: PAS domain S-box protein [Verrucomicrobiota bacterium]
MQADENEEKLLRSVALENARSILLARERAERALHEAKEALEKKAEELAQQREWFQVTLSSIGDAVITTDTQAKVTFLNPVAEKLTGWKSIDAAGQPLEKIFNIINEKTGQPLPHPVKKVLQEGSVVRLANHTALIARDGTETSIEDSAAAIKDAEGKVSGAVMVFHDVTKRRQAEEAVRRNEALLSDFFENAAVGLHWVGPDGMVLRANRNEFEMLGYTEAEYVGQHISKFHADEESIKEILDQLAHGQTLVNREAKLRCKDGSIKYVLISSNVLREDGKFIHTRCFTRDITALKQAEQALRESEEFNRTLVQSSQDSIKTLSLEGRLLWMNQAGQKALRIGDPGQVLGKSWVEFWPEDDREAARAAVHAAAQGGTGSFRGCLSINGEITCWDVMLTPICDLSGKPEKLLAISRDVTERKRADEVRVRLAAVVESSEDVIISKTLDGIISTWNESAERIFGYRAEEVIGRPISILIPADRLDEEPKILQSLQRGERIEHYETVRRRKDGSTLDVSLTVSPIKDDSGKIIGASKIARDISARKRAEEALRANEAHIRHLFDYSQAVTNNLAEGLYTVDASGLVTYMNPAAESLFGWTHSELLGRKMHETIHYKHPDGTPFPACDCAGLQVLQHGISLREHEDVFIRKDGSFFPVVFSAAPLTADGQTVGVVVAFRDDTQRRQTQHELSEAFQALQKAKEELAQHAIKLEREVDERTVELRDANSQLEDYIYSISHDLRHPVRAMRGFSEILLENQAARLDETGKNYLQRIDRSAQLMDKLLLDLLAYGRTARGPLKIEAVPVQRVWDMAQLQCSTAIQQTGARIETIPPLPVVLAHETTLSQILINLLNNALKFITPGVPPHVRFFAEERAGMVRLSVEDNGIGIAPEHHERIFRAFERLGGTQCEGTGIGLSIVRKGAERLGGRAGVESEAGKGSRFWVEFPKA